MSWKQDMINSLKVLTQASQQLHKIIASKSGTESSINNIIGSHIAFLMEAVALVDEEKYPDIPRLADILKKKSIFLINAINKKEDLTKILKEVEDLVSKLTDLAQDAEVSDVEPGQIDLNEVKKLTAQMKEAMLELNQVYKQKDMDKYAVLLAKVVDQCKLLVKFGGDVGCDTKKLIRTPLRKIDQARSGTVPEDEFQGIVKELHKTVREIEKTYQTFNEQSTKKPAPAFKDIEGLINPQDPTELFTILKEIGKGASGQVFVSKSKNNKLVAIKTVPLTVKTLPATTKEIKFMKSIQHQNTLKYYSCYKKANDVWIVMELCECGSVQSILEKSGKGLEEKYIAAITGQVLNGLKYLHEMDKIHRDIKSGNILINSAGVVKIADFGTSADDGQNRTTVIGSSYWMAPETLDQRGYDYKADIWSLGITLIEMAEKDPPFFNLGSVEVVLQVTNNPPPSLKQPNKWTPNFKDFLNCCLQKEPAKRLGAAALLKKPWITEVNPACIMELVQDILSKKKSDDPALSYAPRKYGSESPRHSD